MSDDQNQPPQFNFDLRALREKLLKLTQKELAEAMDCGQELISRLEQHPEAMSLEFFL
ncbi:helix-turn-helix transcriptional regulator [Cohnella ginsengisoli]|uniref:Helix-turn-helix transcriptional regulator n=1 Tax=Cohnella ginsengisoli TaxID=425004 RepID=A0A9X4KDC9_9BACL|nr:helix-turn-helix transcriptional regulator [Cohnella ginsengisoli]MDG0789938.1 helix-turn-helix transcriptional regulator [Cohnella ginsengisoli]